MKLRKAGMTDLESIFLLVQHTIKSVYPKYYSSEVVEFFCRHHAVEKIRSDISEKKVWILFAGNKPVGTGSCDKNSLTRLFVLPEHQGKGYGRQIIELLEEEIARSHNSIVLDASLSSGQLYERYGYKTVRHERIEISETAVLAYEVMEKEL